jgi:hypothetical protein
VQQVPCFGVLWVLDQFFDGQLVAVATIVSGLEAIVAHPRCRLPRAEVQARMERYRKSEK